MASTAVAAAARAAVVVLCAKDSPALLKMPSALEAVSSVEELVASKPTAVVTVPPVDVNALAIAWEKEQGFSEKVTWVHSFS